jgi:hypothetical protein
LLERNKRGQLFARTLLGLSDFSLLNQDLRDCLKDPAAKAKLGGGQKISPFLTTSTPCPRNHPLHHAEIWQQKTLAFLYRKNANGDYYEGWIQVISA